MATRRLQRAETPPSRGFSPSPPLLLQTPAFLPTGNVSFGLTFAPLTDAPVPELCQPREPVCVRATARPAGEMHLEKPRPGQPEDTCSLTAFPEVPGEAPQDPWGPRTAHVVTAAGALGHKPRGALNVTLLRFSSFVSPRDAQAVPRQRGASMSVLFRVPHWSSRRWKQKRRQPAFPQLETPKDPLPAREWEVLGVSGPESQASAPGPARGRTSALLGAEVAGARGAGERVQAGQPDPGKVPQGVTPGAQFGVFCKVK